ncbi:MAG TPA: immune inhibitor A domain-containing protein, partial [Microlunatus sp.]
MPRRWMRLLAMAAAIGVLGVGAGTANADPTDPPTSIPAPAGPGTTDAEVADDLPNPEESNRRDLRDRALQEVLSGKRKVQERNGSDVVRLGTKQATLNQSELSQVSRGRAVTPRTVDQYVEMSRERTDKIFVVLVEFGDERATDIDPRYGDRDTDPGTPGPVTFDGPRHNAIPEPDRRRDNTTIWRPDYDAAHYRQLYFGAGNQSLKTYYERQSSGRYSLDGQVSDWVRVRYNEARYGRSNGFPCAVNVCANSWYLVRDAIAAWVNQQKDAGRTDAEIKAALKSYDAWDRYDHDGDGDFNESDGYLDHFQIVHAGGDQSDGDRYQGEDAVWSHRWRAFQGGQEVSGPPNFPIGGTQIGDTGLWVADYTMQAENGGLSVVAHEYGHDLGLPDHYDTASPEDNAVNWWTLMGQSRLRAGSDVGVGTRPADLGVWDKLALGWLDYEVADAGQETSISLGPHEYNSAKPQALVVRLPPKTVLTPLPTPASGSSQWWSDSGNAYTSGLTRQIDVPAGEASLTFSTRYNIEDCGPNACDYAYVEVNDGNGWKAIPGDITSATEGNGIAGVSDGWVPARFDLTSYAGTTIDVRFRYATNGGTEGEDINAPVGLFLDDIAVTAGEETIFRDGAEDGDNGWSSVRFRRIGSSSSASYRHFYLASHRTYASYDRYLKTGPYHLGWPSRPQKADFFPYQNGLLVNYWDTHYVDNNTSVHPGRGLVLAIDAHPTPFDNPDGDPWRGRIQTYDAPFSLERADSLVLRHNGRPSYVRGA